MLWDEKPQSGEAIVSGDSEGKECEDDKDDELSDVDEGRGLDSERTVEGDDVEGRGRGDSGAMQRGRGGETKKMVRPQRDGKSRVGYCESDDDSDEYANESADGDVGREYQLSDLDERHNFGGF